ncbi:MAG: L,D-transpeptidase family protein [Dissulfurimicrobium sp.]|uniref:L,D-transpeptidase family protein n=1 Tax=Dissulfurimicrobium sp. TaxID=2022436 RepID=UPI00404B5964
MPATASGTVCIIVIDKMQNTLVAIQNKKIVLKAPVSLGIDPDSDKYKTFDAATPEGLYFITFKKPKSPFHRFLGISYPNLTDAVNAMIEGVISPEEYKKIYRAITMAGQTPCDTKLGCGIGIHGGGVYRSFDGTPETNWTEGCIALNNHDIERVFSLVRPRDPVIILNSRRNLYGVIRPFTFIRDIDEKGMPICPDGACTFEAMLKTTLGRMLIETTEGKDYSRSLKVTVFDDKSDGTEPALVLVDQNADGQIGANDSVKGPLGTDKDPQTVYELIRKAVIDALREGTIPRHR